MYMHAQDSDDIFREKEKMKKLVHTHHQTCRPHYNDLRVLARHHIGCTVFFIGWWVIVVVVGRVKKSICSGNDVHSRQLLF